MLIQPNGTNTFTQSFTTKLAQEILALDNVLENFPFQYSDTPKLNLNYPADKIAGFTLIKQQFDIPDEIYIDINDAKDLGKFVLQAIKNYREKV